MPQTSLKGPLEAVREKMGWPGLTKGGGAWVQSVTVAQEEGAGQGGSSNSSTTDDRTHPREDLVFSPMVNTGTL